MEDAALGAFSVFFTQTPSFLTYQRMMEGSKGKSNARFALGGGYSVIEKPDKQAKVPAGDSPGEGFDY